MTCKARKTTRSNVNVPLPGVQVGLSQRILQSLATPVSLQLLECIGKKDYLSVITASVNPSAYDNSTDFSRDWLATNLMAKYPFKVEGIDRRGVALQSFVESEAVCSAVNMTSFAAGELSTTLSAYAYSILRDAQRLIRNWLGDEPDLDLMARLCNFGPGATFQLRRNDAAVWNKLLFDQSVTANCVDLAQWLVRWNAGWADLLGRHHTVFPRVVKGSKVTTVPKSAKTDRLIAIEPGLNLFIQKGIGSLIRRRLRERAGLNLNTAWQNNVRLAREGSRDQSYCTIDLKSASDTVSHGLVEALLPKAWYLLLSQARSPYSRLPSGEWVLLRKFSSMGNGFTFELESMIFYAISLAVRNSLYLAGLEVSVFGDDIVAPHQCYEGIVAVLAECGFTTNEAKSFNEGPFRESCGSHFFGGDDVTPFYIRKDEDTVLGCVKTMNRLRHWSRMAWGLDARMEPAYRWGQSRLPMAWRKPTVPYSVGDIGLHGDFDEVCPKSARKADGWTAFWCKAILPVTRECGNNTEAQLYTRLFHGCLLEQPDQEWPGGSKDTRFKSYGDTMGGFRKDLLVSAAQNLRETLPYSTFKGTYKTGRVLVTQWENTGPWIGWVDLTGVVGFHPLPTSGMTQVDTP